MSKLHILIAEDESLIRLGLKHILEEAGHVVDAAEDGEAALRLADARTPDLAILDIKMPRLDGLETAARLYQATPVPIIFLTAYGDRELVERAARLPVLGYLVKPFKDAELHATIAVAVRRFGEQAQLRADAAAAQEALAPTQLLARAKGLLMQREGISELEAHGRLEEQARRERRTLLEVAAELAGAPAAGSAG